MEEKRNRIQKAMTEGINCCEGNIVHKRSNDWFDEGCKEALIERNRAKIERNRNTTKA